MFWVPLAVVAAFIVGFFAGDRFGEKHTERRWTEAVARSNDDAARAAALHIQCQQGRIGDSENAGRLLSIIAGLKRGYCWCSVMPRKPSENHAPACIAAANAVGEKL